MHHRHWKLIAAALSVAVLASCGRAEKDEEEHPIGPPAPQIVLEAYPDDIAQSIAAHESELESVASEGSRGFSSIVRSRQHRWAPGSTVNVAFYGGNDALYAQIEKVASQWTGPGRASIILSFKDSAGQYRKWSPTDADYRGDIRVGFNGAAYGSYWSLVGVDSRDKTILGGAPNQQSMNLQSFDKKLPAGWDITVLHEFGHALGFEHEHQSPAAQCAFRFEDDPGYIRTKDQNGWFTLDQQDRRPGLYTYLGGYKNFWPKAKVDHNLKQLARSSAYEVGPYDRASIMEYMFDAFMFKAGRSSPCFVDRQNAELSALDIEAVRQAYPAGTAARSELEAAIRRDTTELLRAATPDSRIGKSLADRLEYQRSEF